MSRDPGHRTGRSPAQAIDAPRGLLRADEINRFILPNGLRLLTLHRPGSRMLAFQAYVRAGTILDGNHPGLARFVAATLDKGTRAYSAADLADRLDALGATLSVSASPEGISLAGRALAEDVRTYLELAAEVLLRPVFPSEEVEKIRGRLLTGLRVRAMDTRYAAEKAFRRLAFPAGHPLSQMGDGDEESVGRVSTRELVAFHQRNYRPDRTIAVLVGDLEPVRAQQEIAQKFGGWSGGAGPDEPHVPPIVPPQGIRRDTVTLPGKSQSDLALGWIGVPRTDPSYYEVMLATLILGQFGMMGRIGQRVRVEAGLAYYAYMEMRAGRLPGPWWVQAGVHPAQVERAVALILEEVRGFQGRGPTAEELADARDYLTGSLAVRLETHGGLAAVLTEIELYELGLDFVERYPSIIRGISAEAITQGARRFPVDRYALAVAGPPQDAATDRPREPGADPTQ